jgi:hypothetical protein
MSEIPLPVGEKENVPDAPIETNDVKLQHINIRVGEDNDEICN